MVDTFEFRPLSVINSGRNSKVSTISSKCSLSLLYYLPKTRRIIHRQKGEGFSIKANLSLFQAENQAAIGNTPLARGGVNTQDPQTSKSPLANLPVTVSIL